MNARWQSIGHFSADTKEEARQAQTVTGLLALWERWRGEPSSVFQQAINLVLCACQSLLSGLEPAENGLRKDGKTWARRSRVKTPPSLGAWSVPQVSLGDQMNEIVAIYDLVHKQPQ
jgi:hypothetical protein